MYRCECGYRFVFPRISKEELCADPEPVFLEEFVCPRCRSAEFVKEELFDGKARDAVSVPFRRFCVELIRTYEARRREYTARLIDISAKFSGDKTLYEAEAAVLRNEPMYVLNSLVDRAFELSLSEFDRPFRDKMDEKLRMNIQNGKLYSFERLGLCEISCSGFYRFRNRVLERLGELIFNERCGRD